MCEGVGGDQEAQRKGGRKELRRWVGGEDWSIERPQGRGVGGGRLEKQREILEGCGRGKGLRGTCAVKLSLGLPLIKTVEAKPASNFALTNWLPE